jgi:tRNA nucleotidyltransferase (CCA-adding enzyme)
LQKPDAAFFFPPKTKALPLEQLKKKLDRRGSSTVFLIFDQAYAVPDVMWGQLFKTKRSLHKLIELNDYKILKDGVWSNEKTLSVFIFELEQRVLTNIKKHFGPPLEREPECESFLAKYVGNQQVISGPYIENGRWIVQIPRKTKDVVSLLKEKLVDGGKNAGVAELIAQSFFKKLNVLVNNEIIQVCEENNDFAEFLTDFLVGVPFWLESSKVSD